MGFKDFLNVFVSYLRQFPTPTFLDKHTSLETSYFKLKDCIRELERENQALKQRLQSDGTFSRRNGAYFFETPDGQKEPFCSRCWDLESKLVPIRLKDDGMEACPRCTNRTTEAHQSFAG